MVGDNVRALGIICPFPGTRAYRTDEESLFAGRADESAVVTGLWRTKRLTVLHGAPGTGKTSLLQAGVVPRARALGSTVLPVGTASGPPVLPAAAAPDDNPFARTLLRTWAPGASPAATSVSRFLHETGRPAGPVLVAVDQVEGMFRGHHGGARRQLLLELLAAREAHVLLCVRDDRFGALMDEIGPPSGEVANFFLAALSAGAAVEAIRRPMAETGRNVPPATAEALVEELATARFVGADGTRTTRRLPEVVPWQLQAVGRRICRSWPPDRRSLPGDRLPQVEDALEEALWAAIGTVAESFDHDPAWLCAWLAQRFLAPSGESRAVAEGSAEIVDVPGPMLDALVDRAVLRASTEGGVRHYTALGDRLPEILGRLARRSGTVPRPPFGPADQLQAAVDALADDDPARARQWALRAAAPGHGLRLRFDAHVLLGNIAFAEGDLDAAQQAYEQAVILAGTQDGGPDPATVGQVLVGMGQVSLRRGDPAAAAGLLRSATAFLPADRTVTTVLAKALAAAGEPAAAVALLGTVMTAVEDDDARLLHDRVLARLRERSP